MLEAEHRVIIRVVGAVPILVERIGQDTYHRLEEFAERLAQNTQTG
jgi:hypothetical protein